MQLVGAPIAYIKGPFVVEGLIQGGVGALVALVLLWILFLVARSRVETWLAGAVDPASLVFLSAASAAGLLAAGKDYAQGGMQLPVTVAQACLAIFNAANVSTAAYPFLTIANANLIETFGTADQKTKYLPHLLSGRFFGTMCLSEPQAGSSLSDFSGFDVCSSECSLRSSASARCVATTAAGAFLSPADSVA